MYQQQLNYNEAIKRALTVNYLNFEGRSSRSELWWYVLFIFLINFGLLLLSTISPVLPAILMGIFTIGTLLPTLSIIVRRLHDIGKSGWTILIGLIPIVGGILLLIWYCKESDPRQNEYGPVPNMVSR